MSTSDTSKQLLNRTALLVCSGKKIGELQSGLEALGACVLPLPVLEPREIEDNEPLDKALASLEEYSWIIFTSGYGVEFFLKRLQERRTKDVMERLPKICTVGPATAKTLAESGMEVALIPDNFVAEGVIQALGEYHGGLQRLSGCRILIPRALQARDVLPNALSAAGALVDIVPCYRTVRADVDAGIIRQIQTKRPDLIVFTSSSAVRNLVDILGSEKGEATLRKSTIAVIGPITAKTVASFGKRVDIVPAESTIASLLVSIREYYSRQSAVDSRQ